MNLFGSLTIRTAPAIYLFFGVFLIIQLTGCSTGFPLEPNEETRLLVVGQARLEASNFVNRDMSINGTHTNGIQITIKNMNTGYAEVLQSSGETGIFYFKGTPGHRYQIKRVFFEEYGAGYARSFLDEAFEESQFQIPGLSSESGVIRPQVFSLGTLIWKADGLSGSELIQKHTVLVWEEGTDTSTEKSRSASDETQSVFSTRYPTSLWNQAYWSQITFN